jgi:hypothetical protein
MTRPKRRAATGHAVLLSTLTLALAACEAPSPDAGTLAAAQPPAREPATVVDSVIPMDEALRRFRVDLTEPGAMTSGAATRDGLVQGVVDALVANDTTAFERLTLDRAEWAWLYYPTSTTALPPYELPPGLAWFQLQERNRRGVLRALRELGGHELDYRGYTCDPEPVEGPNRLWSHCAVTLSRDGGDPVTLRIFGAILERDGRFAVLSYTNDF